MRSSNHGHILIIYNLPATTFLLAKNITGAGSLLKCIVLRVVMVVRTTFGSKSGL